MLMFVTSFVLKSTELASVPFEAFFRGSVLFVKT